MTIYIQVEENNLAGNTPPPQGGIPLSLEFLESAALEAIKHAGDFMKENQNVDLTLVLTSDEAIQELNRTYLGIDAPTDVLSFPANELDPDTQARYLGDVIISLPRAQAQAAEGGHSIEAELQLLVVHGVLHCLGYDHADPTEKATMWAVQSEVLASIGCPIHPTTEG